MTPKRRGFLKSFLGFIDFYLNRYIKKNDAPDHVDKNQTVTYAPTATTGNKNQTVTYTPTATTGTKNRTVISPSTSTTTTGTTVTPTGSGTSCPVNTTDHIPFSFVKRNN